MINIDEARKQQRDLILKGMCPYCKFKMKKDGDGFWCCKCNWAITAKGL